MMKRYDVTDKQLEALKKLIEQYEELSDYFNVETLAEDELASIEKDLAELNRDMKFLVEDIESQEIEQISTRQKYFSNFA
ncbi:MAG: hypothetical protein RR340_11350 [Cloacibacillus sp.]